MSLLKFQLVLKQIETSSVFVVDTSFSKKNYVPISLSKDNIELRAVNVSSSHDLGVYINQFIKNSNAEVAYGGYLEPRDIYQRSEYFKKESSSLDERNIHLGIDLWQNAGTKVLAPLDGEIHSFKNNINHGDYGPTIILKHQMNDFVFHSLYGHLNLESLCSLKVGQKVKKGEVIAELGSAEINGDYPPHLHFQIIIDMENYNGDYPGVSSLKNIEFYRNNCPNPNLLLGLNG